MLLSKNESRRDNDGEASTSQTTVGFFSKTTNARASLTLFCTFLCGHFPTTT